eukprot:2288315-Pleurochrysis_carterae.AAC.2
MFHGRRIVRLRAPRARTGVEARRARGSKGAPCCRHQSTQGRNADQAPTKSTKRRAKGAGRPLHGAGHDERSCAPRGSAPHANSHRRCWQAGAMHTQMCLLSLWHTPA